MVDFFHKLEFNDHKYQTTGNVRCERYKEKFLLPMQDLVSFGTYRQSIFLNLNHILKI